MTAAPAPPLSARTRPATPAQLDWLAAELPLWRAAGLVDDRAATAILANYHPSRRFDLSRLLLTLGAAFVGVGILWLVASNLDQLPPLARFGVVAAFWLAFLVGGELLAGRREHASSGATSRRRSSAASGPSRLSRSGPWSCRRPRACRCRRTSRT